MGRKLKFHEQRLLKRTNLFHWKKENNIRIGEVMSRYGLEKSEEYHEYNRLVGKIQHFTNHLRQMNPDDRVRIDLTRQLVDRLYHLGILETASFSECEKLTVACVCRRRLPVVLLRLKFCEKISEADKYVRQGHVRIGPDVVTNPSTLVTREMEDFVGWAHGSKIRHHVRKYNDAVDDFDDLQ
jgi:U3 small nucleolar ribonucleoprotein protein IMP3